MRTNTPLSEWLERPAPELEAWAQLLHELLHGERLESEEPPVEDPSTLALPPEVLAAIREWECR